jgi:hypothetical protein
MKTNFEERGRFQIQEIDYEESKATQEELYIKGGRHKSSNCSIFKITYGMWDIDYAESQVLSVPNNFFKCEIFETNINMFTNFDNIWSRLLKSKDLEKVFENEDLSLFKYFHKTNSSFNKNLEKPAVNIKQIKSMQSDSTIESSCETQIAN